MELSHQRETALYVGAFFDELVRWGVRDVVVSPGSRSTALAMCAYEMSRRFSGLLRMYVDVDERGAGFFALGLAKASGRPAALVCTSGTAAANYYPAVVEAATSRVPLLVLSGDRPLRMQGLGAPQTCDQAKLFGSYVRAFRQMPEPCADERGLAFVRQAAREAVLAAAGPGAELAFASAAPAAGGVSLHGEACVSGGAASEPSGLFGEAAVVVASRGCARMAGPVHLNFPFDEPLKPDFAVEGLFEAGRRRFREDASNASDALVARDACADARLGAECAADAPFGGLPSSMSLAAGLRASRTSTLLDADALRSLEDVLRGGRALVLAGEGTCETLAEAREVVEWARRFKLPLLADPLSGLRSCADACVIDNYDNVMRVADAPLPDVVVRFGRYLVSKPTNARLAAAQTFNVVVDAGETRDWLCSTDLFVGCTPLDFVRQDWLAARADSFEPGERQTAFFDEWVARNDAERSRILSAAQEDAAFDECAVVRKLCELAPANSLLFSANSMSVRAVDTFLVKGDGPLAVLCNRGQNGIDGTVSTALGAAQLFEQTTFLTGDFTMLHDMNALALQRELLLHHGPAAGEPERSVVIVLLNNNGGAIFDMLPQCSDDPYFERLFLVPQDVDFSCAAAAFGVPYRKVRTLDSFAEAYRGFLGAPGISLIEVEAPLRGVRGRYAPYQG